MQRGIPDAQPTLRQGRLEIFSARREAYTFIASSDVIGQQQADKMKARDGLCLSCQKAAAALKLIVGVDPSTSVNDM